METIEQTKLISIERQDYLNLLNRLEKVEKEVFPNEFENLHKISELSLEEIWDNDKDDATWEKYL